jgi:DNA-binding HxlR family transcriptional regulator
MEAILERLERLERAVGVGGQDEGEGSQRGQPRESGVAPAPKMGGPPMAAAFNRWLREQPKPGRVTVMGGAARNGTLWTSLVCWDNPTGAGRNWRGIAGVCQALGSEARLGILRELEQGQRTTAELTTAVGVDRGQLHHHLKELLVQGLVEQPARGHYAVTDRGEHAFLLSCLLPGKAEQQEPA